MKKEIKEAVEQCKEDLKEKKHEVSEEKKKIEELTELLQRILADFDNYKKRVEKERQETSYFMKKDMVTSLLPVLDMFELALRHTENKDEFVKGIQMIYAQFLATLENEGLSVIKETKTFNPHLHEAVMTEDSNEPEGTILEELQKGYLLGNKVIRFSRVKISKNEKVQ